MSRGSRPAGRSRLPVSCGGAPLQLQLELERDALIGGLGGVLLLELHRRRRGHGVTAQLEGTGLQAFGDLTKAPRHCGDGQLLLRLEQGLLVVVVVGSSVSSDMTTILRVEQASTFASGGVPAGGRDLMPCSGADRDPMRRSKRSERDSPIFAGNNPAPPYPGTPARWRRDSSDKSGSHRPTKRAVTGELLSSGAHNVTA